MKKFCKRVDGIYAKRGAKNSYKSETKRGVKKGRKIVKKRLITIKWSKLEYRSTKIQLACSLYFSRRVYVLVSIQFLEHE